MAADPDTLLEDAEGVDLLRGEPVARHGALRLGGEAEWYLVLRREEALAPALRALRSCKIKPRLLHGFSDAYAVEEGLAGALLRLGTAFSKVERRDGALHAGCAAAVAQLGCLAERAGLGDWTALKRYPGSVGGWLAAGALQALGPALRSLRVFSGRGVREVGPQRLESLPRTAVPLSVLLEPELPVGLSLPAPLPFPGSICEGSERLGPALAASGLLGLRLRRIRVSHEQPGLLINLGGASSRDLDLVLRLVRERLLRDHGLEIQRRLAPAGGPPGSGRRQRRR